MPHNITIVDENTGQHLSVAGNNYRIIISGKQTEGSYAVIDMLVPPGGGPGPHAHPHIHESFYVVDGEVEFKTESGKRIVTKGGFVNIPTGGEVHCFKNTSSQMAHVVCTVMPAGLDAFFEQIGTPVAADTFLPPPVVDEEGLKKLKSLSEKYGQQLFPPDYLDGEK